jgi:hypothetical protein
MSDWREVWARLGLGPAINTNPVVVYQQAQMLYARGEVRAAESAYREVLERDPEHLASLRWLVTLVTNRGLYADAAGFRARVAALEARAEQERQARAEQARKAPPAEPPAAPPGPG